MLTGIGLTLVCDLASVQPVLQDVVQRADRDRLGSGRIAISVPSRLTDNARSVQFQLQCMHRFQRRVAVIDMSDGFGFGRVHGKLAIGNVVAERRQATHPHAFLLRSGNLVANSLAGHFTLKLGERQEHVESQAPYRRRGVELLSHRDE